MLVAASLDEATKHEGPCWMKSGHTPSESVRCQRTSMTSYEMLHMHHTDHYMQSSQRPCMYILPCRVYFALAASTRSLGLHIDLKWYALKASSTLWVY